MEGGVVGAQKGRERRVRRNGGGTEGGGEEGGAGTISMNGNG